jgi:hypothetical protein
MRRNKRTLARGHEDLAPLTERILQGMGPPGEALRRRLHDLFREQARPHPGEAQEDGVRRRP